MTQLVFAAAAASTAALTSLVVEHLTRSMIDPVDGLVFTKRPPSMRTPWTMVLEECCWSAVWRSQSRCKRQLQKITIEATLLRVVL